MKVRQLHEAKNVGGHAGAKSPWQRHPIGATIRAAIQPEEQSAKMRSGRARSEPRFRVLTGNFRKEIGDVFKAIQRGEDITPHKAKGIFRQYYTMAFRLGRQAGGMVKLTGLPDLRMEDKRWLESFLRKEFDYWKKFTQDVKKQAGTMPYAKRIEMYVQTLGSVYHTARVLEVPPQTLFFWKTEPAEHCPHCLFLARKSPFTRGNLPTVPASGDTVCKSNCHCKLIARQVPLKEYWQASRNAPSREQLLREMKALARA